MSKTDFDPDEPLAYGQVWKYTIAEPIMLIAPAGIRGIWLAISLIGDLQIREWGLNISGWERLA